MGIPDAAFDIHGVEFHGRVSFLKAGAFYASHVTTVSPTYATEITTETLGAGLHGLMGERATVDSDWLDGYAFALAGPIYAGTNEVQRNVVAERVLGLPKG